VLAKRIAAVQKLESMGSEVMTVPVDVTDETAMQELVDRIQAQWGPVNGLVHAALDIGSAGFAPAAELDPAEFRRQFATKIQGVRVLSKVLAGQSLDFAILASSLSSVLGGLGHGAYASANAGLDACVASLRAQAQMAPWTAINWDGWQFEEKAGQEVALSRLAMKIEEGVESFSRILTATSLPRVVVSTANLGARIDAWLTQNNETASDAARGETSARYERPELPEAYLAPRNETETLVAEIWSDLLGIDRVGVDDNFLDLGGHSLLATQLVSRLRSRLRVEVSLEDVFRNPTIAELGESIRQSRIDSGQEQLRDEISRRVSDMNPEERRRLLDEARRAKAGRK
jgi:NADP-dependent 3-hydroxy acid dehydrogenase YdfG/acyl carrier protein